MSAPTNMNDNIRTWTGATAGESQNDAMRRKLAVPAAGNLQDAIAASAFDNLGGDALYAYFAAPAGTYQDLILAEPGKVAWWKLDEPSGTTAVESLGGRNGTHQGLYTMGIAGLQTSAEGKAMSYSGGCTQVPDSAALTPPGDLTLECLIRPTTIPGTGNAWIAVKGGSYGLGFNTGKLAMLVVDSGGGYNYCVTPLASDVVTSVVYHVAGVWTVASSVMQLYINGVLKQTVDIGTLPVRVTSSNFAIAAWSDASENLQCRIDEVVLYQAALSGATILAHSQRSKGL